MGMHHIVFLGPPGAGKGTHAVWLAEHHGLQHLSTGDMLRAAVREGTEIGRRAKEFMEAGRLVPDGLIIDMLFERIGQRQAGWILDGFPRTVPQAEALDRRLAEGQQPLDAVLLFEVERDELVARLTSRLTCGSCGAIYNRRNKPPVQAGVCDVCGGPIITRPDDRLEAVEERLRVYERQTSPLIDYYLACGNLRRVTASGPLGEIRSTILSLLAAAP